MALRLILLLQLAVLVWAMEAAAELALPGCASHCGNISIPYPSGTTPECYLNQDFFINCSSTHQAFLTDSDIDRCSIDFSFGSIASPFACGSRLLQQIRAKSRQQRSMDDTGEVPHLPYSEQVHDNGLRHLRLH